MAAEEITVRFEDVIKLSPGAEKRYNKMISEINKGKNISKSYSDIDELMADLEK